MTSAFSVALAWTAATDNTGVTGYTLFRDGAPIATLGASATSATDTGVLAGTTHTYGLWALDQAGNVSPLATAGPVTTPAAATPVFSSGFETGTLSHEGMAGTLGAIEYLEQFGTGETRAKRIASAWNNLADYEHKITLKLIEGLKSFKDLTIRGITSANAMHRRVPTVSFTLDGHHPQNMAKAFAA